MRSSGLLDPPALISGAGGWGLAVVCLIVFVETVLVVATVAGAAILGDRVGYLIGRRAGPAIFDRKESGLFSRASVAKTESFFERFGSATITIARGDTARLRARAQPDSRVA
jgi:membrane-associated protein